MAAGTDRPPPLPYHVRFCLPLSPLLPPAEPLFLCERPMQPGMASGWIIPLLSHLPLSVGHRLPSAHTATVALPSEIFRFHDNYCRSISLYFSLSLPLSPSPPSPTLFVSISLQQTIASSFVPFPSFISVHAPKIAAITVCPSQRQTFYVR